MKLPGQDALSQMVFGWYANTFFASHVNSKLKTGSPRGIHKIIYRMPVSCGLVGGEVSANLSNWGIRTCIARAPVSGGGMLYGAFYTSKSRAFEADRHTRVFLQKVGGSVTSAPVKRGKNDSAQDAASGKEWAAWGVPTKGGDILSNMNNSIGAKAGYKIPGYNSGSSKKIRRRIWGVLTW